ncbi:MAG: STAS domain-containing protein [Ignavibacteria bacterium]|nr:STAS domain-containing protein [Ignavibacteria bacterium]
MLDIRLTERGDVILAGRFDAAQLEKARSVLDTLVSTSTVDFGGLEYISSAGLGLLIATQRRLKEGGHELKLRNLSPHIRDIFKIARFDLIFRIE